MSLTKITQKLIGLLIIFLLSSFIIGQYGSITFSWAQDGWASDRQIYLANFQDKYYYPSAVNIIAQDINDTEPKPLDKELKPERDISQGKTTEFPVLLDGKTLFTIKVDGRTTTAEQRADIVTKQIETIAKNYSISVDSIELQDLEEVILITAEDDGQEKILIFGITNDDAKEANQSLNKLANQYAQAIANAIVEYRKVRSSEGLFENIILSVALTLGLVIVIRLIFKLVSITQNFIEARRSNNRGLRIQGLELFSVENESKFLSSLIKFSRLIIVLLLLSFYFDLIFRIFPQTRRFGVQFRRPIYGALKLAFNGFANFLPNLFVIILAVIITYYLIRFCNLFFKAIEQEIISLPGFDQDWAEPTKKIVVILIIASALAIIFPYLPMYNSPAFQGISLLVGALITFGGAATVSNLVGGTVIIYTRAFRLGDLIKTEDHFGFVHEKTILSTRIRTITGEIVTIPNANLMSSSIINYNALERELKQPLMIRTTVTLGYDVPWRKVHQVLLDAAHATENVLEKPAPSVFQTSLDDFYVSYELRAHIPTVKTKLLTTSQLHQNIQDKCNEADIEILSPQYSAIRDGNQNTIPENYLPSDYVPPGFKINGIGKLFNNSQDNG
ncbi:small-conductance mechanosensitive channel [Xenococcus sp. PCC 7305]|uniref:mechanosensitive ion channel family protein n=1 Tax=Xenococcus sp. PCC 7305 TaxID=102125 RepID=UPI0002AC1480|nr:mechanosensitive ion channel family protein [Xenococcus sp. PCC 7305]ELS00483.1 small-conductance mechanosensitive channel [Xenococcus sp. PCC 7305]